MDGKTLPSSKKQNINKKKKTKIWVENREVATQMEKTKQKRRCMFQFAVWKRLNQQRRAPA